jgi:predicted alpha/beta-hydrolase family hydrolase
MEPSPEFEQVEIALPEPVHGRDQLHGVLGIPEWWPTGERVAVVLAHGATSDHADPLLERIATGLTQNGLMTLRFNFPFAEAGKRSSSDSPAQLERAYRAALNLLGRDPTARPMRLLVGGVGLGARVAASLMADRLHADGLFLLGFPLHAQGKPAESDPEVLFRVTAPTLFIQGTRDRRCDAKALRNALRRVGAPVELYDVEGADSSFNVAKKSGRTKEEVHAEIYQVLSRWITRRLA